MRRFRVTKAEAGERADIILAKKYSRSSRSSLGRLFEKGLVTLNKNPLKAGRRLRPGDQIKLDDSLLRPNPQPVDIPIIYEDDSVLVLNKPAGLLTHSKGVLNDEPTVASFIWPRLSGFEPNNRAGIVHRLDRGTSGVLIAAMTPATLAWLQKQFSGRRVKKTYSAIVSGQPQPTEAIIEVPIGRNPKRPQTFRADAGGKPASTHYKTKKVIENGGQVYSQLELYPQTGRTHQLRVHLAYIGHPVVGDSVYGGVKADHLYLHASHLEITMPDSSRKVFSAPLPTYFKQFQGGAS